MNAVVVRERSMTEERIARLESDVDELKGDVKAIDKRLNEFIAATAKEFGAVRTEMEKGFGALRAEMQEGFGSLRTSIESLRTAIESAKLWMLVTGVGSVILVTFVSFLGRVLKLF
jgi:chromosome segregation ATPase